MVFQPLYLDKRVRMGHFNDLVAYVRYAYSGHNILSISIMLSMEFRAMNRDGCNMVMSTYLKQSWRDVHYNHLVFNPSVAIRTHWDSKLATSGKPH